jgi:hypothetical protein
VIPVSSNPASMAQSFARICRILNKSDMEDMN